MSWKVHIQLHPSHCDFFPSATDFSSAKLKKGPQTLEKPGRLLIIARFLIAIEDKLLLGEHLGIPFHCGSYQDSQGQCQVGWDHWRIQAGHRVFPTVTKSELSFSLCGCLKCSGPRLLICDLCQANHDLGLPGSSPPEPIFLESSIFLRQIPLFSDTQLYEHVSSIVLYYLVKKIKIMIFDSPLHFPSPCKSGEIEGKSWKQPNWRVRKQ